MKKTVLFLVSFLLLILAATVQAHEIRPAYLKITEVEKGVFDVFWKAPVRGTLRLKIDPVLPEHFENVTPPQVQVLPEAILKTWQIRSNTGTLAGETIVIDGLDTTITDVLITILFLDGRSHSKILRPAEPSYIVPEKATKTEMAWTYLVLGVEHILLGVDHLLFVFGLLLLVSGAWLLVKTITAFTVGHSISLALATLGFVYVPAGPLNAAIALSIVFLGAELVRARRGEHFITVRKPWIVAFAFGLLHGVGFASALTKLGLPASAIPLALLFFNVGVEIGQLLFILLTLLLIASYRRMEVQWPRWGEPIPAYTIGSVAMFWFIGRFLAMF
jgi:hydrogenase/urease accessory protein HupE